MTDRDFDLRLCKKHGADRCLTCEIAVLRLEKEEAHGALDDAADDDFGTGAKNDALADRIVKLTRGRDWYRVAWLLVLDALYPNRDAYDRYTDCEVHGEILDLKKKLAEAEETAAARGRLLDEHRAGCAWQARAEAAEARVAALEAWVRNHTACGCCNCDECRALLAPAKPETEPHIVCPPQYVRLGAALIALDGVKTVGEAQAALERLAAPAKPEPRATCGGSGKVAFNCYCKPWDLPKVCKCPGVKQTCPGCPDCRKDGGA